MKRWQGVGVNLPGHSSCAKEKKGWGFRSKYSLSNMHSGEGMPNCVK